MQRFDSWRYELLVDNEACSIFTNVFESSRRGAKYTEFAIFDRSRFETSFRSFLACSTVARTRSRKQIKDTRAVPPRRFLSEVDD